MSGERSQFTRLVELGVRVARYWKRLSLCSLALGALLGLCAYLLLKPPYTCEVIVYLQPQPWTGEAAGRIDLDKEVVFTPKPFTAYVTRPPEAKDYVRIMTADGLIAEVRERFEERYSREYREKEIPTRDRLKKMLTAYAPLLLKTPYSVEHTPTIYLVVTAKKPEIAYRVMQIWIEVINEWTHDLTYASRIKKAFVSVESEYKRLLSELEALDQERIAAARGNAAKLEAIQQEWSEKAGAYEAETARMAQELTREWVQRTPALPDPAAREAADLEREQALDALRTERRYGLERIQLAGEAAYSALRRECEIVEDGLERRYRVELDIAEDVAATLTRATPVLAEQFDEILVMNEPRMPETPDRPSVALFLIGATAVCGAGSVALTLLLLIVSDAIAALNAGRQDGVV